jgi:hypothetical protein
MQHYDDIRGLIDRVRARWRALSALHATVRAALAAAVVIGLGLLVSRWADNSPRTFALMRWHLSPGLVQGVVARFGGAPDLRYAPASNARRRRRSPERRAVASPHAQASSIVEPMLAADAPRVRATSRSNISCQPLRRARCTGAAASCAAVALRGSSAKQAVMPSH